MERCTLLQRVTIARLNTPRASFRRCSFVFRRATGALRTAVPLDNPPDKRPYIVSLELVRSFRPKTSFFSLDSTSVWYRSSIAKSWWSCKCTIYSEPERFLFTREPVVFFYNKILSDFWIEERFLAEIYKYTRKYRCCTATSLGWRDNILSPDDSRGAGCDARRCYYALSNDMPVGATILLCCQL